MAIFVLSYEGEMRPWNSGDGRMLRLRVSQEREEVTTFVVNVAFPWELTLSLREFINLQTEHGERHLDQILLRFAIHRIEQGLNDGLYPLEEQRVDSLNVEREDIPFLKQLIQEKTCAYQTQEGRDFFCSAAISTDETACGQMGIHAIAPTSRAVCRACKLPDTDYLCSHFLHPRVSASVGSDGLLERRLWGAMCDLGEAAVKNDPSKCHAMGHRCWERIIETEVRRPVAPISPLTLHEAFDYLDTAWRLAFDKKALLGHGSMVRVARLAFPCTSQEEFESRLSDLSVILKDLNIPDSLLPPENSLTKDKTLLRLAECLKKHIDPSAHEETKRAVKTLQTVNDIRTNLQHGWTRRPLPTALNDLGISYPLRWDDGWVRIQEITAESLRVIREKVQEYAREVANGT